MRFSRHRHRTAAVGMSALSSIVLTLVMGVVGVPLFAGTAAAAAVTASPDTVVNDGSKTITFTGSAFTWTATAITLTYHTDNTRTISASSIASGDITHPSQITATFSLLNKLPGVYDIRIDEAGGNADSCVSSAGAPCFTINGLPPSLSMTMPSTLVTGAAAPSDASVTLDNPARGSDYPATRMKLAFSGVVGLRAAQLTVGVVNGPSVPDTDIPLTDDPSGDIVGFIGSAAGTHVPPSFHSTIPLHISVADGAPAGTLHTLAEFGDVNNSTGDLADVLASANPPDSQVAKFPPGSTYHPVTPVRVLDTRNGTGHVGSLGPHQALSLTLGNTNGVPASAVAVVLNLTATQETNAGYLVAYPTGAVKPATSNVNYTANHNYANLAVVPLGTGHAVTISNESGSATVSVVGDLIGYYTSDTSGSVFHPMAPTRILDTRSSAPIAAGKTRTLTVGGMGTVPFNANVATVNVTVTQPATAGYLRVFKTGDPEPGTSTVNFNAGQTVANVALVGLSFAGQLTISNHSGGTVQVVVDLQGYFTPTGTTGSSLHLIKVARVLDTRNGTGAGGPVAGQSSVTITLGGKAGLPASGITMVAINVTVTQPAGGGHLIVYAAGTPSPPTTSNVNFVTGQTTANLAFVKVTTFGGITIYNGSTSPVQIVADLQGWGTQP